MKMAVRRKKDFWYKPGRKAPVGYLEPEPNGEIPLICDEVISSYDPDTPIGDETQSHLDICPPCDQFIASLEEQTNLPVEQVVKV